MGRITQEARHRQRMMEYLRKHSVTETSIRYHVSRKTVWKWKKRWDGTPRSLEEVSRMPKHSPNQQTEEERELVLRLSKRYKGDVIQAYQRACERGYSRSYGCFKRTANKAALPNKKKKKKKNKPYQRADYPGQKVQIDVKHVPSYCITNGKKYYQFTAKDECSRWTFREMYDEQSTYSAKAFLESFIRSSPFPIRAIQTDNGTEFTNALLATKAEHKSLFEEALLEMGIDYHRIRIATPRHNGKVERQHRTDEMRHYQFSLQDGRTQLARYQRKSNGIIMTCLGMKSPNQVLDDYLAVM